MSFDFSWSLFADVFGSFCLILGAVFIFIAAIGMIRYPDLLSRQHVATKPQVFSLILFLLGVILLVRETAVTWTLLLVIAFQLVSSPISAHLLSRAGYHTGRVLPQELLLDELGEDLRQGTDTYFAQGSQLGESKLTGLLRDQQNKMARKDSGGRGLQQFAESDESSNQPLARK